MEEILKELGWGDGFRIPVANDENRALEMEIQKKQKEKENLKFTLESVTDRVSAMKKHLENVKHQLDQNQNLIFAQNNQKDAEETLAKLARNEDSTLTNEINTIKKQKAETENKLTGVKTEIDRVLQHIEKLNATIKWDKDALLAWDEEISRGDDDTQMLEKFRKEDEAKFNELELKRKYMGVDVRNKRNRLINLKNDVTSLEQCLDKTAQMFRKHQVDRRTLVKQWEGSVRILHQRDEDINRVLEETANLRVLAKERLKDLEEQKSFYENEVKNNIELNIEIQNYNKLNSEAGENVKVMENVLFEENDQLTTLKKVLETTAALVRKAAILKKNRTQEIEAKKREVIVMRGKMRHAQNEWERIKNKTATSSERVDELEKLLREEEKNMEKVLQEFKKLNELLYQVGQQVQELKEGEKNQTAKIYYLETCSTANRKVIAKAKLELDRQKETLYNIDFSYMEKDIALNKLIQSGKEDDSGKYDKKIEELEEIQRKLMGTHNLLTREVNRLEEDMRKLTIDLQGDAKEEEYLNNKKQEKLVVMECGEKQLKALKAQNQNKQVEENVLKLRVKQAEKAIDKVGGKVFCLEKQRLELEEAMKEREVEIKTLRDVLNVRRRVLNEQISNLNARVNLAKLKVENLKGKYTVEVLKLGKDENGEPMSLTYLKIKGAQEKFELQEMGDKLDSQIKKTEKEIEAMENTLKVVNATNKAYKKNLESLDSNSSEQVEKDRLEESHMKLLFDIRKRKTVLDSLEVITLDLEEEYQEKLKMEADFINGWKEKDRLAAESDKELKEQEEKLERAEKQLKRLIKEIRGTKNQKFQTIEEKDIELREILDQNEYGLQQLAELVAKTYDTGPVVVQYLSDKGLALPMIKSPAPSLKCPSTGSLPSARSSISSKSSKSSDSTVSKSSSCVFAPSVITLDSTGLCESSDSQEKAKQQRPCGSLRRKSQTDARKKGSK